MAAYQIPFAASPFRATQLCFIDIGDALNWFNYHSRCKRDMLPTQFKQAK